MRQNVILVQVMHLAGFQYMLAETARDLERIAREGGAEARLQVKGSEDCARGKSHEQSRPLRPNH